MTACVITHIIYANFIMTPNGSYPPNHTTHFISRMGLTIPLRCRKVISITMTHFMSWPYVKDSMCYTPLSYSHHAAGQAIPSDYGMHLLWSVQPDDSMCHSPFITPEVITTIPCLPYKTPCISFKLQQFHHSALWAKTVALSVSILIYVLFYIYNESYWLYIPHTFTHYDIIWMYKRITSS